MALLSDTDPDPTPRSTLCCDSTVGAYKHSDPENKGKKKRRDLKQNEEVGISCIHSMSNTDPSWETNACKFLLHPLLTAESDLNPTTNGD